MSPRMKDVSITFHISVPAGTTLDTLREVCSLDLNQAVVGCPVGYVTHEHEVREESE